jgi:uncharacterized protein
LLDKYIELAEEEYNAAAYLYEGGFLREAASRTYYSMFHAAKALLYLKKNYPKTHAGVISQFGKEFITTGYIEKVFGETLSQAETLRSKADYDIERQITKEEVEDVLESCERFLDKVRDMIKTTGKK